MTRFDDSILFILSTRGLNLAPGEWLFSIHGSGNDRTAAHQRSSCTQHLLPWVRSHLSLWIYPFDDETSENQVVIFLNAIKKGALRFATFACCCSWLIRPHILKSYSRVYVLRECEHQIKTLNISVADELSKNRKNKKKKRNSVSVCWVSWTL
jgi:hypothetical protein